MLETISAKELQRCARDGSALIIDLRSSQEFRRGHVTGAINVPGGRFKDELAGRRGETVVLYCDRGSLSLAVARELEQAGYCPKSVVGGFQAYIQACGEPRRRYEEP